jgi:hypothetical protein
MSRNNFVVTCVGVALGLTAGCSYLHGDKSQELSNVALRSSPDIPAAQGRVIVKGNDAGAQRVTVEVDHMAHPSAVTPGATAYVVWVEPLNAHNPERAGVLPVQSAVNMGVLAVDKDLKGKLQFNTPFPHFDVFVTAEKLAAVQAPSNQKLMTASVDLGNRATQ